MRSSGGGLGSLINAYAALDGDFTPVPIAPRKVAPKPSTTTTAAKKPGVPCYPTTTTAGKKMPPSPSTKPQPKTSPAQNQDQNQQQQQPEIKIVPRSPEQVEEEYSNTREFQKQVAALKNDLLNNNNNEGEATTQQKFFTQEWPSKEESTTLRWMRLSDLAAATSSTLEIFPGGSASNISASQIVQGNQGDCYLNSVLATLAQNEQQRELLNNLFVVKEVNAQGIYAVKLWSAGKWRNIIMDDRFPVVETTSSSPSGGKTSSFKLLFSSTRVADDSKKIVTWVPFLEKALATLHGSYQSLRGGVSMEAFLDLTGMPVRKIRFFRPSSTSAATSATPDNNNNNSSTAVSASDLTKKMALYFKTSCVMAASCGGGAARDAAATKLGLRPSHSYSVLKLLAPDSSPTPTNCTVSSTTVTFGAMVLCRDPWGSTDFQPGATQHRALKGQVALPPVQPGEFWISIESFFTVFNLLVVCITHRFAQITSAPSSAVCTTASSFLPSNLGESSVEFVVAESASSSASVLTRSTGATATALSFYAMASQPQLRPDSSASSHAYDDICVIILKFHSSSPFSSPPKVVAMSEVTVDRISFVNFKITDPGHYIAFPISFAQQQKRKSSLFVTLLAEKSKSTLTFTPIASTSLVQSSSSIIHSSCNKWLFKFIEAQPDVEARLAHNNVWDIFKWSHGLLRCSLVRNSASAVGAIATAEKSSRGTTTTTKTTTTKAAASINNNNNSSQQHTTIIEVDTTGSFGTTVPGRDGDVVSGSANQDPVHKYSVTLAPKQSCIVHLSVPLQWSGDEGTQINSAIAWKFKTVSGAGATATTNQNENQLPKMLQAF
jgi:hypothetical protein